MKQPELIAMCGLPYSGKTTLAEKLARELGAKMLAYDWTWARVKPHDQAPDTENVSEWEEVMDIAADDIRQQLSLGKSVVFDNINHTRQDRDKLRALASEVGAGFRLVYLKTRLEVAEERRQANLESNTRHHVISANLAKAYRTWEDPTNEPGVMEYTAASNLDDLLKRLL